MKNINNEKNNIDIPLTIDSTETIVSRIQQNEEFALGLYNEAIALFLNGEAATSRLLLRDLVNATIGFEQLAKETLKPSKSLHRMLSVNGNPTMDNLALIFKIVSEQLNVNLQAKLI